MFLFKIDTTDSADKIQFLIPVQDDVVSTWETIDSKVAKQQPMGTTTSRAIIEVLRYLVDTVQNRNCDPLK